ncbi:MULTISPECIES: hypothetical protein [unclassified Rhizobium]|uniref:hypothetical protein n=1 Tax=unclassified Rhizobium TaxID=2613769 RepID=UPI000712C993|nr:MULTISPECIES: hypothetical protein [unclassified Rhizobium]KQT01802.1 hypothetical protein ASG50_19125 [Rhizobium sp. Leaf386]KQT03240.1 hypothetical protein ASG42_24855 [Rhizobium sp. Leaf391]KQU08351.1 hypothetical protein ASG68_22430 [Rhizobium sp. Leaf453]
MPSYEETKAAIVKLMATFGTEPRSLYDIGVPLVGRGFEQDPIVNALFDLAHEGVIEFIPGNALRVLKLPAPQN